MQKIATPMKIVATFTLIPGFTGIAYTAGIFLIKDYTEPITLSILREIIITCIVFGFSFGLILFITPAFLLGIIYASLKLKNNWKSIAFSAIFSPIFLIGIHYAAEFFLASETTIPGLANPSKKALLLFVCPLSSIASISAAWVSFPKEEKNKTSIIGNST